MILDPSSVVRKTERKAGAMKRQVFTLLAAVTVAFPGAAQERSPEPPPRERAKPAEVTTPPVTLTIHGISSDLEVRVLSKAEGRGATGAVVASCHRDCELKLPIGGYTLLASQGERQSTQDVDLAAPMSLTVSEPNVTLRGLGTGIGIGGIVFAALGAFVAVAALVTPLKGEDIDGGRAQVFLGGVATVGIGAGLIAGGFSLAAANRAPSMEVDPPRLGHPRGPTGVALSFAGTF
jgi:hypothetical protein